MYILLSIIFLLTCYFIDITKEQCLLKHPLSYFEKKWHACTMFHVTAAVEIECSQIKTIQYFQKNMKLEYLSQIKLAGGHRTYNHINILFENNIALSKKAIYSVNAKYKDF